jgi:hypothetical protein
MLLFNHIISEINSAFILKRSSLAIMLSLPILLILNSCAEIRPLTGGPRDKEAPRLDSSQYSTPNYHTNFQEKEIILTFNEWVILNDPTNQLIISPPFKNKPDLKLKYKSVILQFKEELLPNTTYTVQFGEAVRDYTENNPAQNLRFIFSTGDQLDSLSLDGQIVDANTAGPMDKVWVMLYDQFDDSIPYKERPLYISKTNAQGYFKFENIRSDSFKVFALKDNNSNFKFDQKTEAIAFYPDPIFLSQSTQGSLKMRMFIEEDLPYISSAKTLNKNQLKIAFNRPIRQKVELEPLDVESGFGSKIEFTKDSLFLWFKGMENQDWNLLVKIKELNFIDTVQVKASKIELEKWSMIDSDLSKIKLLKDTLPMLNLHPKFNNGIEFNRALGEIKDLEKIILQDSTGTKIDLEIALDSSHPRKLNLKINNPTEISKAELLFLPGALVDFWGETIPDTLSRKCWQQKEGDFGNLKLKILNADSSMTYIVQLKDEKNRLVAENSFSNASAVEFYYPLLEPIKYSVQLIHDKDRNGYLTTGNYLQKIQSEVLSSPKPVSLRADWDNELEIDLNVKK